MLVSEQIKLRPQAGPQNQFLATSADICVYGGAAGGGKTYGLLLDPLRHKNREGFGAVIFRKNSVQIYNEGGLLDESLRMYSGIRGAELKKAPRPQWIFGGKGKVSFAHIEADADLSKWQGSQIAMIGFDELTHFTERQFFYMLSRNRSVCGVKPYIRATCNPDADSWVAKFIEWWVDPDTGYPIKERSGVLRWFIRRNEVLNWADSPEELWERFNLKTEQEKQEPKSVTFIMSTLFDNQVLMDQDPSYVANLKALSLVERERLLYGNWKIKPAAGLFFQRNQIGALLDIIPADVIRWVRAWDLAATSEEEGGEPAYTSGILMGKRKDGRYVVADVINIRQTADGVRKTIKFTAMSDIAKFKRVKIRLPQDPGQAGKDQAQSYIKFLAGYDVVALPESGSKEVRAEPMAAQWQAGNFDVVSAPWNDPYFDQLESFPLSKFKDMVDAGSSGFSQLELESVFDVTSLIT
jgi:predicted phage terminase large subunit-like protein